MLTVKEVAKEVNVCEAAVRNYIRNGIGKDKEKLFAIQVNVGRRKEYRISASDLQYYKEKYLA